MGRCKLKIEQIKDSKKRATCFRKRAQGLLKKVEELSILCNCQLALVIVSENKTVVSFSTGEVDSILNEARRIHSMNEMYNNPSPVVASECRPEHIAPPYMPQYYDGLGMMGSEEVRNEAPSGAIPAIPINDIDFTPRQPDSLPPAQLQMPYPFSSL